MKLSAISLIIMAGMLVAQKPDSRGSQTGKTPSESSQAAPQSAGSGGSERTGNTSEVRTQSFKGTLVDLACSGGASGAATGAQAGADRGKPSERAGAARKGEAAHGEADRSAGSHCNVSSSSGEFALQTRDGRTLRFDAVGNERVKQELLNRKSWTNASAVGKPIQATVNATQAGDSLVVLSIH